MARRANFGTTWLNGWTISEILLSTWASESEIRKTEYFNLGLSERNSETFISEKNSGTFLELRKNY